MSRRNRMLAVLRVAGWHEVWLDEMFFGCCGWMRCFWVLWLDVLFFGWFGWMMYFLGALIIREWLICFDSVNMGDCIGLF